MLQRKFAWVLRNSQIHPEFKLNSKIYVHDKLGSNLIHLESKDVHKAFAVMFRTTPNDSTGVAHCLEHIALCGSQRYPVRDPFMKMLSRSLNSYMNAWTGSDFTMYPFTTKNSKDFSNLLSVYLDASFFPLLSYNDFLQEAWRVEFNNDSLEFKGVVFNEMKGKASDPNEYFLLKLLNQLMPGTCYEFNSGGDPLCIPKLKYEDLISFHQRFYHPANSTFFFYGDMDIKECMDQIENDALSRFSPIDIDTRVKLARKIVNKDQILLKVPPDPVATDPSKPGKFAVSYLCNESAEDPYTTFLMGIMSTAMFDSQNSPMYLALLESGLGNNYVQGYGYDCSTRQSSFTIGLNGIDPNQDKKIELVIKNTLQDIAANGFDPKLIESALHQVEIRNKEVKSNYGLLLISSMIPFALHGTDPLVPLHINSYVDKLRLQLAKKQPVFQDLVNKYILENNHTVQILAVPDPKFMPSLFSKENNMIKEIQTSLSQDHVQKIKENTESLLVVQNKLENVDILPTLKIDDISKTSETIKYESETVLNGIPLKYIVEPTNGITYIRIKYNIFDIPENLRDLLPLYRRLINSLGTEKHSHSVFDTIKDLHTVSGITTRLITSSSPLSIDEHKEQFVMKIAFLDRNIDHAFDILTEFLTQIKFSEHEHMTSLIQRNVKGRTEDLLDSGNTYGSSLASSSLTSAANSYENLRILKHDCEVAGQLINSISTNKIIEDIESKLNQIHACLMRKSSMEILVHTSQTTNKTFINERISFLENALRLKYPLFEYPLEKIQTPKFEPFIYQAYFTLPIQVNYVVEAFMGTHYSSPDYATLKILCEMMSMKSLLKEVREKGGAYGAGASVDSSSGTICLSSFRDPNTLKTYNAFEKAIQAYVDGNFSDRDIDEGKLGVFGRLDRPVPIYDRGIAKFIYSNY
jgi:presequence protease